MTKTHENYMSQAFQLAQRGISFVEPNPAVGCLIVKDDQIIGWGWHEKFGGPHAEINAIKNTRDNNHSTDGATMYVTLEPCCHFGKTPPCTKAVIQAGIKKIFIAMSDPFKQVAGQGIEELKAAGIQVETGLLEEQARILNAPFIKFVSTNQTWVILKWAQSIDGKLAFTPDSPTRWITGEESRADVHNLRRRVQAILVGVNTVLADDPLLTPRPALGRNLLRIVLDSTLKIPAASQLLTTANESPVLIVTTQSAITANPEKADAITSAGAKILPVSQTPQGCDLHELLAHLSTLNIQQLLVEGGPTVLASFLQQKLADELQIYIAPKILASKGIKDISSALANLPDNIDLKNVSIKQFAKDIRITAFIQ